jgi:hypothetical protein
LAFLPGTGPGNAGKLAKAPRVRRHTIVRSSDTNCPAAAIFYEALKVPFGLPANALIARALRQTGCFLEGLIRFESRVSADRGPASSPVIGCLP